MSSMQEDIQCAGSDTRPPMLDRTDFESWQQRIRLYCLGKDNGENIMKSIKEGPFHMGTVSDVITGGTEGAVQQGPVRTRVLNAFQLKKRKVKMILEGSELTKDDRESQLYDEFEHFCQNKGETIQGYYFRGLKESNFDQSYAYLKQHEVHANENRIMMESWLVQDQTVLGKDYSNLLIADSLLKTIWFINAPCYDNEALASPNTNDEELSIPEQTATGKGTSNPLMAGSLPKTTKPTYNIIPYDQYVEDNEEHGVQSRLTNKPDMVMNDSVTSELARYKELVREYEKRAKFELTDREQKIDEQMRIIISDRNRKETSLKSELHSAQILLSSTVDHYKSKTKEVTLLKKDFKQKEDKFLEEFLDLKKLKDKIEDRLYKQDQSVQTVHMLCKPKSFYDEKHKVAIGYKNPVCLARAKQAQSALYNGHVLVTTNHTPTVIHDSEDTRELAEITRNRMLHGMCVVNILKSVNATPTDRIVLNKEKQIWKPKGKLSDNSLNKTKQIWNIKCKLLITVCTRPRGLESYGKNYLQILVIMGPTGNGTHLRKTMVVLNGGPQKRNLP
ncbi:hypothetical protein Tco_1483254 [Tanacetum coccineum]